MNSTSRKLDSERRAAIFAEQIERFVRDYAPPVAGQKNVNFVADLHMLCYFASEMGAAPFRQLVEDYLQMSTRPAVINADPQDVGRDIAQAIASGKAPEPKGMPELDAHKPALEPLTPVTAQAKALAPNAAGIVGEHHVAMLAEVNKVHRQGDSKRTDMLARRLGAIYDVVAGEYVLPIPLADPRS